MIDARTWQRPAPAELLAMIPEGMTKREIADRLGRSYRAVRYWFDDEAPPERQISFADYLALQVLLASARRPDGTVVEVEVFS